MPTENCVLIDSHCHPHFPPLGEDIAALRAAMKENQVNAALAVATGIQEFEMVTRLAQDYPGEFYAACAVHPNHDEDISEARLLSACAAAEVLAVGETGLDYYRHNEDGAVAQAVQRRRFELHIQAARQLNKPLIIHTRDSLADTLEVLRANEAQTVGGVFHCYTGDIEQLRKILAMNFEVSFTGIVSFKNAHEVRQAAAYVPASRYMVETDSPYLAPAPHRGKTNTPGYVRYVARAMADARGVSEAQIAEESTATFMRLFKPSVPPLTRD